MAKEPSPCMRCDTITAGWLCDACAADELWERENWEADYADDDEFDDCALMPNGQCMKAGSEECDWECGRLHR